MSGTSCPVEINAPPVILSFWLSGGPALNPAHLKCKGQDLSASLKVTKLPERDLRHRVCFSGCGNLTRIPSYETVCITAIIY